MNMLAKVRGKAQARRIPATPPPPDTPLPPSAIARGLRLSIAEGLLSNVHITVTTNAFLTGFALLLGAGDFELGVIAALPFVGQLFQFAGAYLEARLGNRRMLCAVGAALGRGLWGIIAVLPFLAVLGRARLVVFLVVLALSQALLGIAANAWTSWMSDLVPPRQRGRYFGTRNTITSITAMGAAWLAGRGVDYYRATGSPETGYALIFAVAVVAALVGAFLLTLKPEPTIRRAPRVQIAALFTAPVRHRAFRTLSLASAGWAVAIGVAAPFFNAYGLQTLNLSFASLAIFSIVTSAVALVTQPLIGRLQDRYGDKRVMIISVIGTTLLPWGWVFATPTFLLPLWLNAAGSGIFWPGITQGWMNLVMERAPSENRGAYVASFGAITGLGTFIASLLGGAIATALGGTLIHLGPFILNHYALLFVASSLGRAVMALVFARKL